MCFKHESITHASYTYVRAHGRCGAQTLAAVDDHVEVVVAAANESRVKLIARAEQAEKDLRHLRETNAVLSEEHARMEEELATATRHRWAMAVGAVLCTCSDQAP